MGNKIKRVITYIFALLGIMVLALVAGLIIFVPIILGLTAIFGTIPFLVNFIIGLVLGYVFTQLFYNLFNPERILWRN
jgi:hypothetical protein